MGSRSTHSTLIDDATTIGKSLLTAADAAAQRTLLSVYSSSQVDAAFQPLDGDLTALAALSGTNTIYYRSAANTWSAVTIGSGLTFTGGSLAASGGSGIGGSTGATDNRLLRSDGTGGATLQNSAITVDDSGNVSGVGTFSSGAISASGNIQANSGVVQIGSFGDKTMLYSASTGKLRITDSNTGTAGVLLNVSGGTFNCRNAGDSGAADLLAGAITASGLMCCGVYTFATVPSASSNTGKYLRISDRAQKHAYSDGTNWRFFGDDAIIS